MKVLIINDRPHQFSLLKGVSDNVFVKGIEIDIFIPNAGIFYSPKGKKAPLYLRPYSFFCRYRYTKSLFLRLFYRLYIYALARQYSAFDFQGLFVQDYIRIIPNLKRKNNLRIKVTVWGSDFYREAGGSYEDKDKIYSSCDIIHIGTQQMTDDFNKRYPSYANKIRIAHFGLDKLEKMKQMTPCEKKKLPSFLSQKDDKIVIVCGYNGIPAQRHITIIKALANLPSDLRKKLYIILPMTYGTPLDYKREVEKIISRTGLEYHIIDHYMSEEDLIKLRFRTDIAINIQETDAFAGSIQEHLMAGNLLVVGDWLPYHKIFKDNNIFVRYTQIEDLNNNLLWAIKNYKLLDDKLKNNSNSIYNFSSWKGVVGKWVDIYNELLGASQCNK